MAEKDLIILTHQFPVQQGEAWLFDELKNLSGGWKSVSIFCEANSDKKAVDELPDIRLLPNTFAYKRDLSAFFDIVFLSALFHESVELFRKGKFFSIIGKSISVLLRVYSQAKWFNNYIRHNNATIMLYSFWGDEYTTLACMLKSMQKNICVVCRVHGIDVYEERTRLKHIQFRRFQLQYLDRMFSVSEAGTAYLQKRYPQFAGKIETSYLGTSPSTMNPIPGKEMFELISCAKVRNVKRLELVVEILKHLNIPVRWTLAGGGTDFEKLKALCKNLPSHITTELRGQLTNSEITELYQNRPFHYYISTSSTEGLPVAMMESIGHGVPVISTDVGGCKEIVNNVTGILIPADFKPEEVAKHLEKLFADYNYTSEYRNKVMTEWDSKFNAEKNYKKFYDKIISLAN